MRTEEIKIYQFSELSDEAKQKAIEWMRDSNMEFGHWFIDEAFKTIEKGVEAFDFRLSKYSIDWENANMSSTTITTGLDDAIAEEISGVRLYKYLVNNFSGIFWERKHWGEYTKNENTGKWRYKYYSKIQNIEHSCPFTGVCYDDDFLEPFREFLKKPNGLTLKELVEEGIEKVLRSVESEIEYRNTDEALIEDIEANEYEFTEKGKRY